MGRESIRDLSSSLCSISFSFLFIHRTLWAMSRARSWVCLRIRFHAWLFACSVRRRFCCRFRRLTAALRRTSTSMFDALSQPQFRPRHQRMLQRTHNCTSVYSIFFSSLAYAFVCFSVGDGTVPTRVSSVCVCAHSLRWIFISSCREYSHFAYLFMFLLELPYHISAVF